MDAEKVLEKAEKQREHRQQLLRPVAEFFHEHEGEMFERYEAVEELQEYLKQKGEIPLEDYEGDTERLLHQVIGKLCDDRVDPVQNVKRDRKKYVGVIEYEEHDYWYEYIEVDDIDGRRNIGVCAKCVQEADRDVEVAKGIGTTEELDKKIRDHYYEKHSEEPAGVKTGATLASGTTIAGNNAITSANDGSGSGLDADLYRGIQGENLIYPGNGYEETRLEKGNVLNGFVSPSGDPKGVGVDSNSCIWNTDNSSNSIYRLDQSGTVENGFSSPSATPIGLGISSSNSIWNTDITAQSIYELDRNGSVLGGFASPSDTPRGLGLDSSNCVWNANSNPDSIYRLDQSGAVEVDFPAPGFNPEGIGVDSNDCIWHADSTASSIYLLNRSGSVVSKFTTPSGDSGGVGLDSSDSVWHADSSATSIYKIRPKTKVKYK
jgi:streptogramin lyase